MSSGLLLMIAAAVTVYGIAQAATVSHPGSEITSNVAGANTALDSNLLQGVALADILEAAGTGKSLPVFKIKPTASTYNGELGGRFGANQKCQSEFGSDAIMFGTQHINCYSMGTCLLEIAGTGIAGRYDATGNARPTLGYPISWAGSDAMSGIWNCNGWTVPFGTGGVFSLSTGVYTLSDFCGSFTPIFCAVPK